MKKGKIFLVSLALMVVSALGPLSALAGKDNQKLYHSLPNVLAAAGKSDQLPVLITFKDNQVTANLTSLKKVVPASHLKHTYKNLPVISAHLTKDQIMGTVKLPEVAHVEYDQVVHASLNTANYWYGTSKARTDFGVNGDRDGQPLLYSKKDSVIAVIDTGIDITHLDLSGGKVIGWRDFVGKYPVPYDDNGHGTHVSSIAAGAGAVNPSYKGVASNAALVGVKVLDHNGSGTFSNVLAGIDWCISNRLTYGISVINMSLGIDGSSNGTDALSLAVNAASDAGIVPVVAAGNSGPKRFTVGSPAAASKAVTVGAMADVGERGFNLALFSSRGPTADFRIKPDLVAPGYGIMAAKAGTINGYVKYSGTSMATPFVAGTVALMLDANPSLTPAQVKSILLATAINYGPAGADVDYGNGNLNGYAAIRTAGNFIGTGPILPNHLFAADSINKSNTRDEWRFNVTSLAHPIAITFIIPAWVSSSNPNFNIELINPQGVTIATSNGLIREELITFNPTSTGFYRLKVRSAVGTGNYFFDLSASVNSLTKIINDAP